MLSIEQLHGAAPSNPFGKGNGFDAKMRILRACDRSLDDLSDDLLELVSRVAQGERTNAERLGHREGILYFNYQDPEKVPCEWHF